MGYLYQLNLASFLCNSCHIGGKIASSSLGFRSKFQSTVKLQLYLLKCQILHFYLQVWIANSMCSQEGSTNMWWWFPVTVVVLPLCVSWKMMAIWIFASLNFLWHDRWYNRTVFNFPKILSAGRSCFISLSWGSVKDENKGVECLFFLTELK